MAKITVEQGIYDAWIEVSEIPEVETGQSVSIFVRTGRKTGSGDRVFYEAYTAFGTIVSDTVYGLDPDTWYTANASLDGGSTWIGAVEFQTDPEEAERPKDWYWWSDVSSGAEIDISAEEWNAFTARIDEFRVYDGVGEYGNYVKVSGGTEISKTIVNRARAAMIPLDKTVSLPSAVESGDTITAKFFNDLKDALNSVP